MDDFIVMVLGAFGVKDFPIYIQVPHSKFSKAIAEGMCHGGLSQILPGNVHYIIKERRLGHGRRHFDISVQGVTTQDGRIVNTFQMYVQMPNSKQARDGVEAMTTHGLQYWLGVYAKNITVTKCDETHVGLWEAIGADIVPT